MNFAIATLILLIIIFPGFAFRWAYLSGRFSKNFLRNRSVEAFTWSLFPGIAIQCLALLAVSKFKNQNLDFLGDLSHLLFPTTTNTKETADAIKTLLRKLDTVFFYNFFLLLFAVSLGFILQTIVRFYKLDRRFRFLRYTSHWHYTLSGEMLEFDKKISPHTYVHYILVQVLIQTEKKPILYAGRLQEWVVNDLGDLESICISAAKRKTLDAEKFIEFPSHILVIPYKEVLNINLVYFSLEKEKHKILKFVEYFIKPINFLIGTMMAFGILLLSDPEIFPVNKYSLAVLFLTGGILIGWILKLILGKK